jgi:hypothetical protein
LEQLEDRTLLSAELISAANPHLLSASGGEGSFIENANNSSISADGRFVVFDSNAPNLTPLPTNRHQNIYVRDLLLGTTTLVSVNAAGTAGGGGDSSSPVISANGRFVAFDSLAPDLVANDTNDSNGNVGDVFVRDLRLGTTTLVSVNFAGTGSGNQGSGVFSQLAISADGRFVEFDSFASDLVPQATNNLDNIFVRNLATGTTSLVTVNPAGTVGGDQSTLSFMTTMSADGRFIAFQSDATNLVANDTNGITDVFVRDMVNGVTKLVSVNENSTASGNDRSFGASISANGRFVVFQSNASDLVPNDTNGTTDVFVRDLVLGTTTLVSVNASGTASGDNFSGDPSISADGRRIAFDSAASDLTPMVQNRFQVYVRDLDTDTTTLVSVNDTGTGGGISLSEQPVISADGQSVAFLSLASDLVPNDNNQNFDVFLRNLKTNTTTAITENYLGTGTGTGNRSSSTPVYSLSSDGAFVAFDSGDTNLVLQDFNCSSDVFVRDMNAGQTILVSQRDPRLPSLTAGGSGPSISGNGRFVAFTSDAANLTPTPTDNNCFQNAYVRDRVLGTTTLVSVNMDGHSGNADSFVNAISPNGRFVVFTSSATGLTPIPTNPFNEDIYVRDLKTNQTSLVTVNASGTGDADAFSFDPVISANGRFVAFLSFADNLTNTPNPFFLLHVYVRDLVAGTTTLVDVNRFGTAGGDNSEDFSPISISANGHLIAFGSFADDLVANDDNGQDDVFVRDWVCGVTTLVSVNAAGTGSGNGGSSGPVLTPDGTHVAFDSSATDLVAAPTTGFGDVFVRDLSAGVTTLVSINQSGTSGGNSTSFQPTVSDDGNRIAFTSFATDLVSLSTTGFGDVFVRDLSSGTTMLVSVNNAGTGGGNSSSGSEFFSNPVVLSADGARVVFRSFATNLVSIPTSGFGDVFSRELPAGITTLVSVNRFGTAGGDFGSGDAVLSRDGSTVAFDSVADDLVAGDFNGMSDVFASAVGPSQDDPSAAAEPASLDPGAVDAVLTLRAVAQADLMGQSDKPLSSGTVTTFGMSCPDHSHPVDRTLIAQPASEKQTRLGNSNRKPAKPTALHMLVELEGQFLPEIA